MNATMYQPRPAGFWIRLAAVILDGIFLLVMGTIFFVLIIKLFPDAAFVQEMTASLENDTAKEDDSLINLLFSLLFILYNIILTASPMQGTLGKKVVGIMVATKDYERVGLFRAIFREVGHLISTLILLMGYVMAAFTPRKRALHDYIAGTVVIYR
jgi:uncharacterized RDD family membrane protein YckC